VRPPVAAMQALDVECGDEKPIGASSADVPRPQELLEAVQRGPLHRILYLLRKGASAQVLMKPLHQNLAFFASGRSEGDAANASAGDADGRPWSHQDTRTLLGILVESYGVDATLQDALLQTPLFYAAREGNREACRYLVQCRCEANKMDSFAQSPIFYSARNGHESCAELLVELRCAADVPDRVGETPLFWAAQSASEGTVRALLRHGAEPRRANTSGQTPLFKAAGPCAEALLEARCDVNHHDTLGQTVLFKAAANGQTDMLQMLVSRRGDLSLADRTGSTCFFHAAKQGHVQTCKVLVEQYNVDLEHKDHMNRTVRTVLGSYSSRTTREILKLISSREVVPQKRVASAMPYSTPVDTGMLLLKKELYAAVVQESAERVQELIERNADPLGTFVGRGQNLMFIAAIRSTCAYEVCRLLCQHRVQPATVDEQLAQTPLFFAVRRHPHPGGPETGGVECARFLLAERCEPDHADIHGQTALFYAARRDDPGCAQLLLASRASVNKRDNVGKTACCYAAEQGTLQCLDVLVDARADVTSRDSAGRSPMFMASARSVVWLLLEAKSSANAVDNAGATALSQAASLGHGEAVRALVAAGSDVYTEDLTGQSCLFHALAGKEPLEMCRLLVLELGADVGHRNKRGETVLDVETDSQNPGVWQAVEFLREHSSLLAKQSSKRTRDAGSAAAASDAARGAFSEKDLRANDQVPRRKYRLIFDDPRNPARPLMPGTPEYHAAVRALVRQCSWLDGWTQE